MATFATREARVAAEIGLPVDDMNLAQECSDFYLLERMHNELHPWDGDMRFRRGLYSDSFGTGSRRERRAVAVTSSLEALERRMGDVLAKYMIVACGGEARYFWGAYNECEYRVMRRVKDGHKGSRPWFPSGVVGDWLKTLVDEWGVPAADGASITQARVRPLAWSSWYKAVQETGEPGRAMRELAHLFYHPMWVSNATFRAYAGYGHRPLILLSPYDPWTIKDVIMAPREEPKYQKNIDKMVPDPLERESKENAIEHANHLEVSISVGGKSWGKAAALCADYLDGVITPRTFLDRCWSIQHNGGSLFNKLWRVGKLQEVLERQAHEDYPYLAAYARGEVRTLWIEHAWEPGKPWPVTSRRPRVRPVGDFGSYCGYCYQYLEDTGEQDPCNAEWMEPDEMPFNSYCAYAIQYCHLTDDTDNHSDECECDLCQHDGDDEDCECDSCSVPNDEDYSEEDSEQYELEYKEATASEEATEVKAEATPATMTYNFVDVATTIAASSFTKEDFAAAIQTLQASDGSFLVKTHEELEQETAPEGGEKGGRAA